MSCKINSQYYIAHENYVINYYLLEYLFYDFVIYKCVISPIGLQNTLFSTIFANCKQKLSTSIHIEYIVYTSYILYTIESIVFISEFIDYIF